MFDAARRADGITLLELLIALAILAVAWTMAGPALTTWRGVGALDRDAQRTAAALREARSLAIAANRPVAVVFDLEQRSIAVDGAAPAHFDPSTQLTLTTGRQLLAADHRGAIVFHPDGSASGGEFILRRAGNERQLTVDWLIGTTEVRRVR